MAEVSIRDLRNHGGDVIDRALQGEQIIITRGGKPVAELRPIKRPRPVGLGQGKIVISPDCFDPLPEEILDAFEGKLNETAP